MEKQYRLKSNLLMLNHLPTIFNMLHILNMMVYGFVVNQPVFFISALNTLQKTIRIPKNNFVNQLRKQLLFSLRDLYFGMLTSSVLLVLFANRMVTVFP